MTPWPSRPTLDRVYATDENIAIRRSGDFAVLCPDWQKLAYGHRRRVRRRGTLDS